MKKCLSMALAIIMLLCLIPTTTVFAAKGESISQLDLTVTAPVDGAKPSYDKIDGRGYYSDNGIQGSSTRIFKNGIAWFKSASSYFSPGTTETFVGGTTYTVKINLLPKGNFVFETDVTAKINGNTATVETYDDGSILVVATLTSPKKDEEINQLDLSVTTPADGEKPTYTKIDGTGYYSDNGINGTSTKIYKNGIAWFKSTTSYISPGTTETFKGGTDYTVKIALTPKDGYKFGASVNAKINGKAATVEAFDDGSINVSVTLTATKKEHTHTAGSTWQYDDTEHWKICSDKNCGTLVGEKQMHSNSDADGKCDVCGYQLPIEVPEGTTNPGSTTTDPTQKPTDETSNPTDGATEPTDSTTETSGSETTGTPTTDGNTDQKDNGNKDNGIVLWIILGIAVVLAAGAVVAVIVNKKKK